MDWKVASPGTAIAALRCSKDNRRKTMENSVDQARWLLAPIFAISITFLAIGIAFS